MSLFFRIFQHLLPDAIAWRIRKKGTSWTYGDGSKWGDPGLLWGGTDDGRFIDRFFAGLAKFFAQVRLFVDLVYLDLFSETTRELAEWEYQFGLLTAATEDDRRANIDSAWKARGGQSPRYLQDVVRAAGFDVYIHEWWEPGGPPWVARNPRLYTNDPTFGTVQCGEPLALCGEPDALCNNFLANEPGYLVNSNLTPYAPPVITNDPTKWPYFLYWGGAVFPDLAPIDPTRRQEFERLILKLCPTQHWLVTLVDYGIVVPIHPSVAFADLIIGWMHDAGVTTSSPPTVDGWDSTLGSHAPVTLAADSGYDLPEDVGTAIRFAGADWELLAADTGTPLLPTANTDAYFCVCLKPNVGDDPGDYWEIDFLTGAGPGSIFLWWGNTGFGNIIAGAGCTDGDGNDLVFSDVPAPAGDVLIMELWSDGTYINFRVNGGTTEQIAWTTSRWFDVLDWVSPYSSPNVNADVFEFHVNEGYPGDDNCEGWRAWCAQEHGYAGP